MELNNQLYQQFPQNVVCLYNRALLLEKMNRFSDAAPVWKKLICRIETFVQSSNGFLVECHFHLAEIYRRLDKLKNAWDELKLAAICNNHYQPEQEMDGPYTTFNDTKKAINKVIKKLLEPQRTRL